MDAAQQGFAAQAARSFRGESMRTSVMEAQMKYSAKLRILGGTLFTILFALPAGYSSEARPKPAIGGPQQTLAMVHLATIVDEAWAWGSEARPAFDGTTMFVPNGAGGVTIYGLGVPEQPERLGTIDTALLGGQGGGVAAAGGRAFVLVPERHQIVELDVSTPSAPLLLCRFAAITVGRQLALRGTHLYATFGPGGSDPGGFYVYDISQSPPVLAGQYTARITDPGFCVSEDERAFQARPETFNWTAEIDVVDMADPAAPDLVCTWRSARAMNIWDMCWTENLLYCAAYLGGIYVLGGSEQQPFDLQAHFDWSEITRGAWSVAAAPPYVFVARGDSEGGPESFQAFRLEGGALALAWEQATLYPVDSVTVSDGLLVTVERQRPDMFLPKKIITLYRIFAE
jgi:hypothetical protein